MTSAFVVLDDVRGVIHASSSPDEAAEAARFYAKKDHERSIGYDMESYAQGEALAVAANPPSRDLLGASGLRPVSEAEVMGLSLEAAHASLAPYFLTQSGKGYAPYDPSQPTPLRLVVARGILKQNAKLMKTAVNKKLGEVPSVAYGMSLIPSVFAATGRDSNGQTILFDRMDWAAPNAHAMSLQPRHRFNLCPFATHECMRSCLVKSGQNDNAKNYPKLLMTYALQNDQVSFMRLLVAALDRYFFSPPPKIAKQTRFVRLNVYSDIAWEHIAPWLFQRYTSARGGFYDYTKVPGRIGNMPQNYDLTFSYSGSNLDQCASYLGSGTGRVAVVFLKGKKEWPRIFNRPSAWAGFPVVNGDRHDFRPFDPAGVWVALRWKSPKGFMLSDRERRDHGPKPVDVIKKFVIRADLVDGEWVTAEQPRQTKAQELEGD